MRLLIITALVFSLFSAPAFSQNSTLDTISKNLRHLRGQIRISNAIIKAAKENLKIGFMDAETVREIIEDENKNMQKFKELMDGYEELLKKMEPPKKGKITA